MVLHKVLEGEIHSPLKELLSDRIPCHRFFQQVGETVGSGRPISDELKKKCHMLGKEIIRDLNKGKAK